MASDTDIPEFLDKFAQPMPILYLRARLAAPGIISLAGTDPDLGVSVTVKYQYDIMQIRHYLAPSSGPPYNFYGARHKKGYPDSDYGLADLGAITESASGSALIHALAYFKNPSVTNVTNAAGTPRSKDGYILISAGADGVYGTIDDLCSFGELR